MKKKSPSMAMGKGVGEPERSHHHRTLAAVAAHRVHVHTRVVLVHACLLDKVSKGPGRTVAGQLVQVHP